MSKPTKAARRRRQVTPDGLTVQEKKFAAAYVANGGNGTQAMKYAAPHTTEDTQKVTASNYLTRPNVRESINKALIAQGITFDKVSSKINDLLDCKLDEQGVSSVNKGVIHARAVMGLDAPKEQKIQVDKRVLSVSVEGSIDLLDKIIKKRALPPAVQDTTELSNERNEDE